MKIHETTTGHTDRSDGGGKDKRLYWACKENGRTIISADSMQVYRHMDIGWAKIRPEEMDGVKHYLIDVLEPTEEFHVVRFQKLAKQAMEEIYENGLIPIVTGGTGFYIQALLYDIDFTESREDPDYRRELSLFADRYGEEALHEKLREVDEEAANEIHPNNRKRVIRALEFYHLTGKKISLHNEEERKKRVAVSVRLFCSER